MRKAVQFIQDGFERIRSKLLADLSNLSSEELNFVPKNGIHSPLRLFLHVVQVEEFWLRSTLIGERFELGIAVDYREPSASVTLDDVKRYAHEVRERLIDYLEGINDEDLDTALPMGEKGKKEPIGWILYHILEHEALHEGQIRLIAELAGRELPVGPLLFAK